MFWNCTVKFILKIGQGSKSTFDVTTIPTIWKAYMKEIFLESNPFNATPELQV